MEFIAHRINTLKELKELDTSYGVELDLRDDLNGRVYISHNPFEPGEDFEEYLKHYHHGTMILNVKSERIEHKILELLKQYDIQNYFFLDSSFPMIKLLSDLGEHNIALRFSELEGLDTIRNMAGKAKWVWVDCFSRLPIDKQSYQELKNMGYQLCMVFIRLSYHKMIVSRRREWFLGTNSQFSFPLQQIHSPQFSENPRAL